MTTQDWQRIVDFGRSLQLGPVSRSARVLVDLEPGQPPTIDREAEVVHVSREDYADLHKRVAASILP